MAAVGISDWPMWTQVMHINLWISTRFGSFGWMDTTGCNVFVHHYLHINHDCAIHWSHDRNCGSQMVRNATIYLIKWLTHKIVIINSWLENTTRDLWQLAFTSTWPQLFLLTLRLKKLNAQSVFLWLWLQNITKVIISIPTCIVSNHHKKSCLIYH